MSIKLVVSKRTFSAPILLVALLLIGSLATRAQERYETLAGASQKTITAVITWQKDFVTTPDENNPQQPAADPCWPFSISVNSAVDPVTFYSARGTTTFTAASVRPRYKLKGDMHVCTFEVTAPLGIPLVIEPGVKNIGWLNAKPVPGPLRVPGPWGGSTVGYHRGFTPKRRPWTLGGQGVYMTFTFTIVAA